MTIHPPSGKKKGEEKEFHLPELDPYSPNGFICLKKKYCVRQKTTDLKEMLEIILQQNAGISGSISSSPEGHVISGSRRIPYYKATQERAVSILPLHAALIFVVTEHSVEQRQEPAVSLYKYMSQSLS